MRAGHRASPKTGPNVAALATPGPPGGPSSGGPFALLISFVSTPVGPAAVTGAVALVLVAAARLARRRRALLPPEEPPSSTTDGNEPVAPGPPPGW